MLLYMKPVCRALALILLFASGSAQAVESRYAFVEPHLSAELHRDFQAQLQSSRLWQLPLATGQTQVVRLTGWDFSESRPFFWSQTRLDERSVRLKLQVKLEIWENMGLHWQGHTQVERSLRLMGPELRGSGLAFMSQLAQLPHGSLIRMGPDQEQIKKWEKALLEEAIFALWEDYHAYHRTKEPA